MEASEEYDKLIWPIKASCRIFACWPLPEAANLGAVRLQRFHRTLTMVVVAVVCLGTSAEVAVFFGVDMNETIECSLIASALYLALMRLWVFDKNQGNMRYVVEAMRRDWANSTEEERVLFRDRTILAFKLAKFFIICVASTSVAFVIMPLLEYLQEGHIILPYRGYYFFNHTQTTTRFVCVYTANSLAGMLGCSTIAGGTSFSLVATIHAAAKFSLVQRNFQAIKTPNWLSNEKVGKCVQEHQECIRFAETVEEIINFLALAQFVVSTGLLCFAGFQLTTMLQDHTRLMKYAQFLNAAIMELFIFSYSGQCLITESENVAESTFSSDWYGTVPSTNIQLIVMRSRKPCSITAGKFYDMSLESFLKVMSTSFSYFTVLLTIKEE